jgi:acetyltransferase-like isoleucine patch superfamily enzyme
VNFEAGSVICNFRNERPDPEIHVRVSGLVARTGVQKFGALVGDESRLGANSVLAPGALLPRATLVARASLVDQDPTV